MIASRGRGAIPVRDPLGSKGRPPSLLRKKKRNKIAAGLEHVISQIDAQQGRGIKPHPSGRTTYASSRSFQRRTQPSVPGRVTPTPNSISRSPRYGRGRMSHLPALWTGASTECSCSFRFSVGEAGLRLPRGQTTCRLFRIGRAVSPFACQRRAAVLGWALTHVLMRRGIPFHGHHRLANLILAASSVPHYMSITAQSEQSSVER